MVKIELPKRKQEKKRRVRKVNETIEGVSWQEILERAPQEARRFEDLIYLNYDIVEEFIDVAKSITEFEKGGFACGKRIAGEAVGWDGFQVFHFYDFILCRNTSSQPKVSYRPHKKCQGKVMKNYGAYAILHAHPENIPPSPSDYKIAGKLSTRTNFLITPDTFMAYARGHPFTIIFDTGKYVRSKSVTKVEDLKHIPAYIRIVRKEVPLWFNHLQLTVTYHNSIKRATA